MRLRSAAASLLTAALAVTLSPASTGITTAAAGTTSPAFATSAHAAHAHRASAHRPSARMAAVSPATSRSQKVVGGDPVPQWVRHRATSTAALYRQAGMVYHPARGGHASRPGTTPEAANSSPSGSSSGDYVPYLTRHVDQSCNTVDGTGTDGNRVQAMYVHEASQTDRYSAVAPVIINELKTIDDVYAVSSFETGGGERIRWVYTDGTCAQISLLDVTVPDGSIINAAFSTSVTALQNLGYTSAARKYLIFADAPMGGMGANVCGRATQFNNSTLINNPNDGYSAQYALVDNNCWTRGSYSYAAHELTHTMGAVNSDAPHANTDGHCTDGADLMCYNDGTTTVTQVCPAIEQNFLDCNKDDYFNTNPPAGSYLATHWNVANSSFLDAVPPLPPGPAMTVTADKTSAQTGQTVTLTANVASGVNVNWTTTNSQCVVGGTTGTTFTLDCPFGYGTQTVTATATNGGVMDTIKTATVTITPAAEPTITENSPTSAAYGSPFTQTVNVSGGAAPYTYKWETTDTQCTISGSTTGTTFTRTCPASAVGSTVDAKITVTTADQRTYWTTLSTQITAPAPTAQIVGPSVALTGRANTFSAQVSNAPSPTYMWSSANGWISGATTGPSVTVTPPAGATASDTLTLTVIANGTSTKTTYAYDVAPPLSISVTGPRSLNTGSSTTLTATVNKTASLAWSIDNTTCTITGNSATATLACPTGFTGPVTVTATATATNGGGAYDTTETVPGSWQVSVVDPNAPPVLSVTAPSQSVAGSKVNVQASNTGNPVAKWAWTVSKGACATDPSSTAAAARYLFECPTNTTGPVTVTVTGTTANGVSASASATINLTAPVPVATLAGPSSIQRDDKATLTATVTDGNTGSALVAPVVVSESTDGGSTWTTLATTQTAMPSGSVALTVAPTETTLYKAAVTGSSATVTKKVSVTKRTLTASLRATGGYPVRFTGTFTDAETGASLAGKTVTLQAKWVGTTKWANLTTVTTGSSGVATDAYNLKRAGYFRYRFPGDATYAAATTPAVLRKISLSVGGYYRRGVFHAHLSTGWGAAVARHSVRLQRRPRSGGAWRTVATKRTDRRGNATVRTRHGTYVWRWVAPATATYNGARSGLL